MSKEKQFLRESIERYDLALVKIVASVRPQELRAELIRVYSSNCGLGPHQAGRVIEFVKAPGHWGQPDLKVGNKALMFLRDISGRLRECPWHGHMVVEWVAGDECAIYPEKKLWANPNMPPQLRDSARQDPGRPYATAIKFDAMEKYLCDMISSIS